jgi:NitT/TauT family transport system ATP-binding protein
MYRMGYSVISTDIGNGLKLEQVSFEYNNSINSIPVLNGLSAIFYQSETTAIVGPSGCGKTTLLNIIAGIFKPTTGNVICNELSMNGKRRVGYVFQTPSLIPWMTIRENALFGAEIASCRNHDVEKCCDDMFTTYGLAGFERSYPSALSIGMQQRVAMIRAVLSGARVLLLDEPFTGSDFLMRRELHRDLVRIVSEMKLIAVFVTHDIEEAVRIANRVIVLSARPSRVQAIIPVNIESKARVSSNPEDVVLMASCTHEVETAFISGKRLGILE